MNKKTLLWMLVLLMMIYGVAGLGVRPAKTEIVFAESPEYSGELWVVNNDHQEFSVKVYLEGQLGRYVTLDTEELSFREDEEAKVVGFTIHLPETIPAGESTVFIVIEEQLNDLNANVISSRVILKHRIRIQGEYPDKYVNVNVNFHQQDDNVKFTSEVENLGRQDLGAVTSTFYVDDRKQQEHALETETVPLKQKETKLFSTDLEKNLFVQGQFDVATVVKYDDQQLELLKELIVGQPEVDVTYFNTFFIAQKINPYSLDLENKWNKPVNRLYVDVDVKKDGQVVDEFRTKSIEIDGLATEQINDYLNGQDKDVGSYDFDMEVNFWNTYKMEKKTFHSEFITEEQASKQKYLNIIYIVAAVIGGGAILLSAGYGAWQYIRKLRQGTTR